MGGEGREEGSKEKGGGGSTRINKLCSVVIRQNIYIYIFETLEMKSRVNRKERKRREMRRRDRKR
jgi:hypothetical protein